MGITDYEWYKHLNERWPNMKATSKLVTVGIICFIVGGIALSFFDRYWLIAGRDTVINSKDAQINMLKDTIESLKTNSQKNDVSDITNQKLITAGAYIDIIVDENDIANEGTSVIGGAILSFENKQEKFLYMFTDHTLEFSSENKKLDYNAKLDMEDSKDKAVGRPISQIFNANCIKASVHRLENKKIIQGTISFTFNGSIRYDVNVPPQTAEDSNFVIYYPQYIRKGI